MDANRTNYSTHAVDALLTQERLLMPVAPGSARITGKLGRDLVNAPKFMLPDNGMILSNTRSHDVPDFDLFRLPFPITVIEFIMEEEDGGVHRSGVKIINAQRRLAIGYDLQYPEVRRGWADLRITAQVPDDGVLIWPINDLTGVPVEERQALGDWNPNWCGVHIPGDVHGVMKDVSELPPDLREDFMARNPGVKRTGYFTYKPVMCGEVGVATSEDFRERGVLDTMLTRDVAHEVTGMVELGIALSCRNVRKAVIPAPAKLNVKRERNGKTPFFDYHVLTIDVQPRSGGGGGSEAAGQGDRASPRSHLRRGHIRRLESGAIWVNATLVNPSHQGFMDKDYRLRKP